MCQKDYTVGEKKENGGYEMKFKRKLLVFLAAVCLLAGNLAAVPVMAEETSGTEASVDCTGKYVNIALVVDTTGSMAGDIETVKENLSAFVKEIAASGAIPRIALIEYKDIQCDGDDSTVVHKTPDYSVWYDDAGQMVAEIEKLEAYGGGDSPESLVDALGYVTNDSVMTFNRYAAKFAFVLTDAAYNNANRWGYKDMNDAIAQLSAKGIQTTVVTHKDYYADTWDEVTDGYIIGDGSGFLSLSDVYADLTSKTGGTIIDMSEDFEKDLSTYAKSIIAATASTEVDDSYVPVTSISLGEAEEVPVVTGGAYKFPITVNPSDATVKDIIWSVEDESVATINKDLTTSEFCVVNPVKEGTTKLIAKTTDGGYTAFFTLTVADSLSDGTTTITCKPELVAGILTGSTDTKVALKLDESATTVDAGILKDIFTALSTLPSKDVTFSFQDAYGEELYSWNFSGSELKDASTVINSFKIETGAKVDAVSAAVAATGTDGTTETIHFTHDGLLPGTATVKERTSLPDGTSYLYYYNPSTGKLEEVGEAKVEGGWVTYKIEHCCDYVLSSKVLNLSPAPTPVTSAPQAQTAPTVKAPDTGDNTGIMAEISLFVVAIALVSAAKFMRRKRA